MVPLIALMAVAFGYALGTVMFETDYSRDITQANINKVYSIYCFTFLFGAACGMAVSALRGMHWYTMWSGVAGTLAFLLGVKLGLEEWAPLMLTVYTALVWCFGYFMTFAVTELVCFTDDDPGGEEVSADEPDKPVDPKGGGAEVVHFRKWSKRARLWQWAG